MTQSSSVISNPLSGLDTYLLSPSYDAPISGAPPAAQKAYTMAGEASETVNLTYRSFLEQVFSLSQSSETTAIGQAANSIKLLQIISQMRQSALTGKDYVNGFGTDPFIMSDNMVKTLDLLSIQMASNNLTPAHIINWAAVTTLGRA